MNAVEALDDYLLGLLAGPAATPDAQQPPAVIETATSIAEAAAPDAERIAAELLAEMDADPAFAAQARPATVPSPAAAVPDAERIAAELLAEMDADPAFANAARPASPPAALAATPAAPPHPATNAGAAIARRPPPRPSRLPPHIQAMFQPTPATPDAHRRAAERSTRWLRLRCGEQTYALELLKVQEVVLPVPLLPLRGAARAMLGIMNLRGQVVPVLDLGVHLGAGPVGADAQARVVVLEENGETLGLRVSAVEDVSSLTDHQIEPPDNTRLCRISNHLFRGVARIGTQPIILLDASQLLH